MKNLLVLILLFTITCTAQKKDPDAILNEVISNFEQVQDYKVDVKVKVDVPFIKAPDTEAKIYFKQPDKIHFASDKFALVPKEGLDFSPMGLLKSDYTAIYIKDEDYNGAPHSVIKIIPLEDRGDVILSTLWINNNKKHISRVESSTKVSGNFIMEMFYYENIKYPLPSEMIFTLNFPSRTGMRNQHPGETDTSKDEKVTGKVYITYSGYEVNKGIPDSVFEQKESIMKK
jgi:hypothetical protein